MMMRRYAIHLRSGVSIARSDLARLGTSFEQIIAAGILFAVMIGVVFYNETLGLHASSRLPYFFIMPFVLVVSILPLSGRNGGNYLIQLLRPGTFIFFLTCFVLIEIIRFDGTTDAALSILNAVTILALAIIFQHMGLRAINIIMFLFACMFLGLMYPLAAVDGHLGLDGTNGSFVGDLLPMLKRWFVSEKFLSGRGTIGMFGTVLAAWAFCRKGRLSLLLIATCVVPGLFFSIVSDSRAAIIIYFLLVAIRLLSPKPRHFRSILLTGSLISFVLSTVQALGVNIIAAITFLSFLARKGMDIQQLGRVVIVETSRKVAFATPESTLVGYGSPKAQIVLKQNLDAIQYPEAITAAHNFILQVLLDGGLIAYIPLAFFYWRLFQRRHLIDGDNPDHLFALSTFLIVNAAGWGASLIDFTRLAEQLFFLLLSFSAMSVIIFGRPGFGPHSGHRGKT